jgi:ABC-type transporter Mla subunit MlaD
MTVGELEIGLSVDGADSAESATASLGDAIREMTLAVTSLAEEFTNFEGSLERAEAASEQASESIRDVGVASDRAASQQDEIQSELNQTAQAADRAADAQDQLSGTTGQATNVITGFGDATQDALVAGPAAAANNLTFIAEGFGEIVQTAGGLTAGLRSVGSALLGPAGIILGVQLAISVLPPLIDALSEAGGVSEGLSASLAALGAAILPIQDELKTLGVAIKDAFIAAFNTTLVRNALGNLLTVITAAFKTIGEVVEFALNVITLDFDEAFGDLFSIAQTIFQAIVRVIARNIDVVLASLQTLAGGVDSLFGTSFGKGAQSARQNLKEFFDGFTTDLKDTERQVVDTASTIGQALASFASGAGSEEETDRPTVDRSPIRAQAEALAPDAEFDQQLLAGASVEQVQEALGVGLVQSIGQADAALSSLRKQFNSATSDEQRQRIQALITRVKRLKKGFQNTTRETNRFKVFGQQATAAVQKGLGKLSSGIGSIIAGLTTGANQFKSFAQVARQAVQSVISQLASLAVKLAVIAPLMSALGLGTGGASLALPGIAGQVGGGLLPGAASGGFVEEGGLARIHKGEHIVPAGEMGSTGGTLSASISMDELTFQLDKHLRRRGKNGLL